MWTTNLLSLEYPPVESDSGNAAVCGRQREVEEPGAIDARLIALLDGAADTGFASKPNLRLIQRLQWRFVFAFARTWKLEDGAHLRDLANHLSNSHYRRIASYTPDQRRRDYWVFVRRAKLKTVGDVTVILSKRRRNEGPKKVKLIVTNLETERASEVLNDYARR